MNRSIIIMGLAVCSLCECLVAQQSGVPDQKQDKSGLIESTGVLIEPTAEGENWLEEKIDRIFGVQGQCVVFHPVIPEWYLAASVFEKRQFDSGSDEHQKSRRIDTAPPPARALKPLLGSPPAAYASTEKDESHVALATAMTEVRNESVPSVTESSESKPDKKTARDKKDSESSRDEGKLASQIEEAKKTIGADEQMDKAKKNARLDRLTAAQNSLNKANGFRVKKQEYNHQLEVYPGMLEQLSRAAAETGEAREANPPVITEQTSSDSLQLDLQPWLKLLQDERKHFVELENDIAQLNNRITKIPSLRAAADEELVTLEESLSKLSKEGDDADAQLTQVVLGAKRIALKTELEMLESEARRQELAGKLLPMQRDKASREIKRLEATVGGYEKAIADLRRLEIKRQVDAARLVRFEAVNAHPALKDIANRNQELTQLRSNITERIQAANDELVQVNGRVVELEENKKHLEGKIEVAGGVTHSNGMLLVESRRRLATPFESNARIKSIQAELQTVNIARQTLEEERKPLADPVEFINEQLGKGAHSSLRSNLDQEPLLETGVRFAQTKRQYLDDLLNDYAQFRTLLGQLEASRKELVAQIDENREYIDKMALWVRNSNPISMNDVRDSAVGIREFFASGEWEAIGNDLANRAYSKPHESALGACGLMMLALMTRRLKQK